MQTEVAKLWNGAISDKSTRSRMRFYPIDNLKYCEPKIADLTMRLSLISASEYLRGHRARIDQERKLVVKLLEWYEVILGTRHDQRVLCDQLRDFTAVV